MFFNHEGEEETVNIDAISLDEPSWYVIAATETREPEKWLAYSQNRKASDPRYSVAAYGNQRANYARAAHIGGECKSR